MNFFVESVRIIDLFFRQLSSVFYSGGTRSSIIFCLFDRCFSHLFTARHSNPPDIKLNWRISSSSPTQQIIIRRFFLSMAGIYDAAKNYNNLSHIPQYPELSCYAKKTKKKNTFVWGCLWLCCCFLTIVCFDTKKRSVHAYPYWWYDVTSSYCHLREIHSRTAGIQQYGCGWIYETLRTTESH